MKKLIRSLVVASGGLFITATASYAASISFISTPIGTQLDSDQIFDIETVPGRVISFTVLFDTNGITTNPSLVSEVEISFSIELDMTELELVNFPSVIPATPNGFRGDFAPLPQNMEGTLITFQAKVLNGLINDGMSDMSLKLNSANIGGRLSGQDVSSSFGGAGIKQTVEVQPVPEPTTIFGSALALGVGGWLKRKKSSQQNKTLPQH